MTEPNSQLLIYQSPDGIIKIDVRLEKETVWLTQKLMAELFQTSVPNINMHLKSIYEEGELEEGATIKDFLIVQKEGNRDINRTQKFCKVIDNPLKVERQEYNRFRFWGKIEEFDNRILRVITLDDKKTIHNAFPDRRFEL